MEILRRYKAGEAPEHIMREVLGLETESQEAYRILAFAAGVHPEEVDLSDLLEKELPDSILVLQMRELLDSPKTSAATRLSTMKLAHELKGRLGKTDPRASDPGDIVAALFDRLAPTPYLDTVEAQPPALPQGEEDADH